MSLPVIAVPTTGRRHNNCGAFPAQGNRSDNLLEQGGASMTATDVITGIIKGAVAAGVREALNVYPATNRRVLSAEESAEYVGLSKAEIYNLMASGEIPTVAHGRRKMVDILDLDDWIERKKRRG